MFLSCCCKCTFLYLCFHFCVIFGLGNNLRAPIDSIDWCLVSSLKGLTCIILFYFWIKVSIYPSIFKHVFFLQIMSFLPSCRQTVWQVNSKFDPLILFIEDLRWSKHITDTPSPAPRLDHTLCAVGISISKGIIVILFQHSCCEKCLYYS